MMQAFPINAYNSFIVQICINEQDSSISKQLNEFILNKKRFMLGLTKSNDYKSSYFNLKELIIIEGLTQLLFNLNRQHLFHFMHVYIREFLFF